METTRRQYTAEFKRAAVALVTEQGYTITAPPTAHEISLHARRTTDVSGPAALCRHASEFQWVLSICATRRKPDSA